MARSLATGARDAPPPRVAGFELGAAAAEEAAEAAARYEKERPGLGAEFERAVDAALDLLEQEIIPLTSMPRVAAHAESSA